MQVAGEFAVTMVVPSFVAREAIRRGNYWADSGSALRIAKDVIHAGGSRLAIYPLGITEAGLPGFDFAPMVISMPEGLPCPANT